MQLQALSGILILCAGLAEAAAPRVVHPSASVSVRPGGTSYTWTYGLADTPLATGLFQTDSVAQYNVIDPQNGFNWVLTRGTFQYSTDNGANWVNIAHPNAFNNNYISVAGKIFRFVDALPADSTTTNNIGVSWTMVGRNESVSSGKPINPDTAPTDIVSNIALLFDDTPQNYVVASLNPTDVGETFGGYWQIDAQSNSNLFTLSFDNTTGDIGTVRRGTAAVPAIGQNVTLTARYFDQYQTDITGAPLAGQGFAKTLTYTVTQNATADLPGFGPEFSVNTFTANSQSVPAIARLSNGNFVVVWRSSGQENDTGSNGGIYGRIYNQQGVAQTTEFRITPLDDVNQNSPVVAALSGGRFLVAYTDVSNGGDVYYRIVNADTTLGSVQSPHAASANSESAPKVATLSNGNVAISWSDGTSTDVYARVLDGTTGAPVAAAYAINTTTTGTQSAQDVASIGSGNFVVVWRDPANSGDIRGRTGNATGPVSGEFAVAAGAGSQSNARVAGFADGSFYTAITDAARDGDTTGELNIYAERFNSSGTSIVAQFRANATVTGNQFSPAITGFSDGSVLVGWQITNQDLDNNGVFARRFSASGVAVDAADRQVNQKRQFGQSLPVLTAGSGTDFAAAWVDSAQEGQGVNNNGIEARVHTSVVLPTLSINDVSVNEGNAGTTNATFTVSLSAPAGAGGVSFDIATANNTATAGSDYLARSLTAQTIAAGSSSYSFTVQINGDTTLESNETFFVNVSNLTGATLADGQGQGTLVNDDCAALVVSNGNNSGAGSLRQALVDVCSDGTIVFQSGVTTVNGSGDLSVAKSLTIDGGTGVTISAGDNGRVFNIGSGLTVNLRNLTIRDGNIGGAGTGLAISNAANLTLTNCTVSSNRGQTAARGAIATSGPLTLVNSTVSHNSSNVDPAGLLVSGGPIVVLKNSIVALNTTGSSPSDILGTIDSSSSFNLIGSGGSGGLANGVNGNLVGVNPLLGALALNGGTAPTRALLPGSPAINAGTAAGAPTTDQRGIARVGNTDIGAFESRGFSLSLASGNNQSTPLSTAFAAQLAVTVAAVAAGEPVDGGAVSFTPPGSGASSTIAGNPATIAAGVATTGTVTANATAGGPYAVVASANGAASGVSFGLTNIADSIPPTALVTVSDTSLILGETALVTFTFSEAVGGFTNADLTVANGSLTSVTSSNGVTFTATLTPNAGVEDPTNLIVLNMAGVSDLSGNPGLGFTNSNNYAIDTLRPTLASAITISDTALRIGDAATVTFVYTERVGGFTIADVTVPNGTLSGLGSGDGGITWTATLTPSPAITDASNVLTLDLAGINDLAGNAGSGTASSANYAIDTARPVLAGSIAISDVALKIGDTATVAFGFSEAVTGFTTADVTAPNATLSGLSTSNGGINWTATLTPAAATTAASNVLTLDLSGLSDLSGNLGASADISGNYQVDTVRPALSGATVADTNLLAGETSLVSFVFTEAVSGFTTADLLAQNGTLTGLTTGDGGITWTATLTPTASIIDASNEITVDLTGISDAIGNPGAGSSLSNNYAINTVRPTASIVVSDTLLVAGETSLVTFTFSEVVTGFANADLTVANGTLTPVSSADGGLTYSATLTPTAGIAAPTNVITLNNSGYTNAAGNAGSGTSNSNNYAIDTLARSLSINNVSVAEGNSSATLNFTVTVTPAAADGGVSFNIATQGGTATAGADYTANSQTGVTIAAGQSSVGFAVTVIGENLVELNETVLVNLSGATGAVIATGQGIGTISNDDSATVQFAPTTLSQSEGAGPMAFTATLSNPVDVPITVNVNSANGTAGAADFTQIVGGAVTFAASDTSQSVTVLVNNDALDENDEGYSLTLSGVTASGRSVTLGTNATATGTILDDDLPPTMTLSSPSLVEGNDPGSLPMNFEVRLSAPSGLPVSYTFATGIGTATPVSDYGPYASTLGTIPPGNTFVIIQVGIVGDTLYESNETVVMNLSGVTNATPDTLTATGTIIDDDQEPTTTTINSDLPDPSAVGQPYTVAVTVAAQSTSPTGTVSVSDGSASCTITLVAATAPASTGSCNLTSTSAGAKTLTASYTASSSNFGNSTGTTAHQVNPAATTISVSGPARSRINQPTPFSAALAVTSPGGGTPTGTVTLTSGASSCTATLPVTGCNLTFTALGSRTVSASYAGDGNYAASSSSGAGNTQTLVYALSDVLISKTDAVGIYQPGELLVYTVTVRNFGPDAAAQIRARDDIPAGLANTVWSCDASGGAVCPVPGGVGSLDAIIPTLPVGGLLNFTFYGNAGNGQEVLNTALIELPADTTIEDPTLANNTASDLNKNEYIFRNGYEDPQINAPSGSFRVPASALRSVLGDVAVVIYRLDDRRGEALRLYARQFDGRLQYALALRNADGRLRLGPWQSLDAEPQLRWTAVSEEGGWVLNGAGWR